MVKHGRPQVWDTRAWTNHETVLPELLVMARFCD